MRAPPMPAEVVLALAWFFIRKGHLGGAVMLVIGFDCFLRTGEMLSLQFGDIVLGSDDRGIIKLEHTKTGQRHAAFEASALNDPACGRLYRAMLASLPGPIHRDHYIFLPKAGQFYKMFNDGLRWLQLDGYGFKPFVSAVIDPFFFAAAWSSSK